MSFYFLGQNNSGGEIIIDEIIAAGVIIEADSIDQANDIALKLGVFSYWSCDCCGDRFDWLSEKKPFADKSYSSAKEAFEDNFKLLYYYSNDEVLCIIHFLDGRKVKVLKGNKITG